jgi:hypothetical protein
MESVGEFGSVWMVKGAAFPEATCGEGAAVAGDLLVPKPSAWERAGRKDGEDESADAAGDALIQ